MCTKFSSSSSFFIKAGDSESKTGLACLVLCEAEPEEKDLAAESRVITGGGRQVRWPGHQTRGLSSFFRVENQLLSEKLRDGQSQDQGATRKTAARGLFLAVWELQSQGRLFWNAVQERAALSGYSTGPSRRWAGRRLRVECRASEGGPQTSPGPLCLCAEQTAPWPLPGLQLSPGSAITSCVRLILAPNTPAHVEG